ncbi:ATP-dependent Clp protease ATP-binding subunit [Candidatus Saccharibacteria bacterium]|nr:ATP-dependent Clp protease ATP-binding subunit [Candidatus Saccharibacteria bacterium]
MFDDFSDLVNKMTDDAKASLQQADIFSRKLGSNYIGTEHLLLGILAQQNSAATKLLTDNKITLTKAQAALDQTPKVVVQTQAAFKTLSEAAVLALRMAHTMAYEFHQPHIGTEHILYSLVNQKNSRAAILLVDLDVDLRKVSAELDKLFDNQAQAYNLVIGDQGTRKKSPGRFLKQFGIDLTNKAENGQLDVVIGRNLEIERVVTILARRTKSNPVLIGEPGVGKTAIVEGLAQRIVSSDVPDGLLGKRIIQIDLANMVAGTKFRGEFEERLSKLVDEAVANPDVILFVDEMHLLNGTGSAEGSMDAANILKPSLAKGQIRLIGATTFDEYRKYIEKDKALARRLQTVIVGEPDVPTTLSILKGIRPHYEDFHGLKISDKILSDAIFLSNRYIYDRFLPDKVIDVLDEAAALAQIRAGSTSGGKLKKYMTELKQLNERMDTAVAQEDYEKAALYKTRIAQIETSVKKIKTTKPEKEITLEMEDLATAISLRTNIPVSKVQAGEKQLLLNLQQHLNKYIIGQDDAIDQVAQAIKRGRSGIADSKKPIGSFIFMGPTGVGKTELARVLAREVFGGDDALIKVDMSEFSEKHNVARLVGAPAGYVGYDDGGKLTEAIRRRPYSVVLFDEIEKAHPDVFNILLQILEDGILTDGQGNKVKFNNTIVILTSNLGSSEMMKESELGFTTTSKADDKKLTATHEQNEIFAKRALSKLMRPELLNRFDGIIVFNALTKKDIGKIFDNLIGELKERLIIKGLGLIVKPTAKNLIITAGFDAKNGARPLRRAIETKLERIIAEQILADKFKKGTVVTVSSNKNELKLTLDNE